MESQSGKKVVFKYRIFTNLFVNCRSLWRNHSWLLTVFFLSLLSDAVSTIYVMLKFGIEIELHPVIYFVSKILGPVCGPLFGAVAKIIAVILVAIYSKKLAFYLILVATAISFLAAAYNLWNI